MLPLLLLSGCASIIPVPYTVQPSRITNPAQEVKQLILANTVQGCVTEPEVSPTMLTVKFVCSRGVGNAVVRFDRVANIKIEQSGEWYRVMVTHKPGTDDFDWTSRSLEDIQRLADAISALASPADAAPAPQIDTTKI